MLGVVELVYSIYEAKAKLSEIIRHVKRRRSVTITERGREVARVVPSPATNSGYCPNNFEVANFKNFRPEFYACVRRASVNENPEVRVVIKGNAAGRGGIPSATGEVPFQMEAQVMGRGVYSKQRSGS